ncbi:hypothetical protein ADEAN_000504300 [Angomonas deanei]|uniref:Uncharacterized protein n=1 Tax=Angomonas deanei TaxID=59799 RepID=A0A7G2CDU8_9TRYP|nr:hypothetical protein ADEAN_000504300 [Angomonas deanei]
METFRRLLTTLLHHHHLEEKETVYTGEEVDAVIQLRELRERLHFEKAVREETDRIMAERQGQMEAQQHRIEQQNDELGRLRLKLAEYEEKFAHLRHVLVPLVVREMDAVQSDEQGRNRRAEKERTERLEKLSDIDARLHKIRRVTEEDYVVHTDVDYVEPKPI